MHELSIVTYVIKQVDEIAKENKLTNIQSVTLEFGEVSGIVPEVRQDLPQLRQRPYLAPAGAGNEHKRNSRLLIGG